jgi:hypothetical protein
MAWAGRDPTAKIQYSNQEGKEMEAIKKAVLAMLVMLGVASVVDGALAAEGQAQNPQAHRDPAQSSPAQNGPDIAAARHFLESLYVNYRADGEGVPNQTVKEADVYEPSLLALMHANQQAAGDGEVGYLDGDPLCDCQDFDIRAMKLVITPDGKNQLVATVSFHNIDRDTAVHLKLRFTPHGWRVADVISTDSHGGTVSLRAALAQNTLELTRDSSAH